MCDCFYLGDRESTFWQAAPPPARDEEGEAEALRLADESPWVDVHAHPGRCFLRGLPDDDLYVAALGKDSIEDSLADQAAGRVSLSCYATVSDLKVLQLGPDGLFAGRSFEPGEAYADHTRQVEAIRSLCASGAARAVRSVSDVESVHADGQPGVMITCEGADFLEGEIGRVAEAYSAGVRSVTLVHYRVNELGDIQTEEPVHDGLSGFGGEVVREMNRLGMIVDLAHATHKVTTDALRIATAPTMISHSHLAAGENSHPRLLSIDHACAVADAGGLIGAWPAGVAARDLDGYVDEIFRLIDLVGVEHVAIGTDLDANYQPVLTRYDQYPIVAAALLSRGLEGGEVRRIMGENFIDLFGAVSAAADR